MSLVTVLLPFSGFKYRSHSRRDRTPPPESGNGDTVDDRVLLKLKARGRGRLNRPKNRSRGGMVIKNKNKTMEEALEEAARQEEVHMEANRPNEAFAQEANEC